MATRLAGVVNANLETCLQSRRLTRSLCERLVRWIDECVAACHAVSGASRADYVGSDNSAGRVSGVSRADYVGSDNSAGNVKGDNSAGRVSGDNSADYVGSDNSAGNVKRDNSAGNVKGDNSAVHSNTTDIASNGSSASTTNSNSNALPEHFVEDVLLVVNQMTQKETFEALYRAMLFRHLVACQFGGRPSRVDHDVLLPEEMRIIDEIKAICGNVFVSRMDSLAKDSLASREFTAYLQQQPGGAQLLQQCQFHVVSKGGGVGGA